MPRPSAVFGELEGEESPAIADSREGEIIVLLGKREKTRWFLHLLGKGLEVPLSVEKRGTLMFLAGECAGLLFAGVS